jgi:hypothetical protein
MTKAMPTDDVLYRWGETFRVVVAARDEFGPKTIRLQMRKGEIWNAIASNYDVSKIKIVPWSRQKIHKHMKHWRYTMDKRAKALQEELEELVTVELAVQQEVGAPNS